LSRFSLALLKCIRIIFSSGNRWKSKYFFLFYYSLYREVHKIRVVNQRLRRYDLPNREGEDDPCNVVSNYLYGETIRRLI
jgi:hypothetical protein